jgi:2-polyprenyl-6-hydroxyphenyl methylase/3-demethylubiquinone-9 3-methyltransferase
MSDNPKSLNVDPSEIEKFSAVASKWWDMEGEFAPLHKINPLRTQWILDHANKLEGKKVIDVGCGGGILAESLAKAGANVTGIDLAQKSLTVARLHSLESQLSIDYKKIPAEEMAEQYPEHFDVVTCMEMLEHVPDPHSIIRACTQMVKPGGWVFFSTINRNLKSFLQLIVAAEYILGMVPRGTHSYKQLLKPSELRQTIEQSGLSIRDIKGLEYNIFSKTYSLTQDATVNYFIAAQK